MTGGSITDVAGIAVGHHQQLDPDATLGSGWATGTTVVLAPPGTVGAVDVRGGAPGTRETDLLDPGNSVRCVDAIVLSGGSAYGLAAADGVMTWLEQQGRGLVMDDGLVPIVPAAVIFDLPVGNWANRPTAEFGRAAAQSASRTVATGNVGAGTGARAGVLKGGVGTASITLDDGITVGALVVVNSAGNVIDPSTGLPWMSDLTRQFGLNTPTPDEVAALGALDQEKNPLRYTADLDRAEERRSSNPLRYTADLDRAEERRSSNPLLNTTIAVVATDAAFGPTGCQRVAIAAHDGFAHTIRPAHTPIDGDTIFALATGAVAVPPDDSVPDGMSPDTKAVARIGAAAADVMARAVIAAVLAAQTVAGIPAYRDLLPSAFERMGS